MIRKSLLALAAVAALGAGALSSTDAFAKKGGHHGHGWHKGGVHIGIGHGYGWRHRYWAPSVGIYTTGYDYGCYKVVTPRGRIKLVCSY